MTDYGKFTPITLGGETRLMERDVQAQSCGCVGPQNGEPLCPCAMRARGIVARNGRWIEPERDLGPVETTGEVAGHTFQNRQMKG